MVAAGWVWLLGSSPHPPLSDLTDWPTMKEKSSSNSDVEAFQETQNQSKDRRRREVDLTGREEFRVGGLE